MNKATFHSLTAAEQSLILETEPPALLELDEDALLVLHDRVRKARAKAVSKYRRGASARVEAKGARGQARVGGPNRDALKAEVFEEALGRVSARLARLARESAKALKEERLAAARAVKSAGSPRAATPTVRGSQTATRARSVSPVEAKTRASTKSSGKRTQAKRDAR